MNISQDFGSSVIEKINTWSYLGAIIDVSKSRSSRQHHE